MLQANDAAAMVGNKRGRDELQADDLDPSKRSRPEGDAAVVSAPPAAAEHLDPALGAATDAAAAVASSAGFAAQLGAGGQLFAMTGADGQPMLQVVPLQLPGQLDASGLGQLDLTQLDPNTLQALNLQAVNMGDMQQLVLHMPGQDLTSQLQLAGMSGTIGMHHMGNLGGSGGPRPSRDAVVAHIKDAVKMLMHASEELQRKRRQQNRRTELNQRRAMLLPDGSAAPGAMPTYSGDAPATGNLRPNNMLAAIQSLPPQEKRAMLVSALKRALPIMMQTAQVRVVVLFGYFECPNARAEGCADPCLLSCCMPICFCLKMCCLGGGLLLFIPVAVPLSS